jgi:integrase
MYDDQGFVFTRELGDPLNPDTVSATWQRITQQGGVQGMRLHDLRHFHATMLLRTGIHPKVVQERLGHSEIGITLNIYSHVVPGLQEQAARAFAEAMDKAKKQPS